MRAMIRGGGRRGLSAAALVAGAIALAGCTQAPAATVTEEAAVMEEIPGTDLNRLILTEKAVERLDLATETVSAAADGRLQVPYGALIYDTTGKTWVYTNPKPLTYIRAAIEVERIDGKVVRIASGPPAGTSVVTVGAAELFGAEFDTAH